MIRTIKKMSVVSMRAYYVKVDNFYTSSSKRAGYQRFEASSPQDLLQQACQKYGCAPSAVAEFQLWSSRQPMRLDHLEEIPVEEEFLLLRAITHHHHGSHSSV
jgi:hypothetical protein